LQARDGRYRSGVRPPRRLAALLVAATIGIVGCGGDDDSATTPGDGSDLVTSGARAYSAHCAECHGEDLRGTLRGPSFLSIVYEPNHHSDDAFRSAPRNGVTAHHWGFGDMPPVAGITDAEIEAIIAFVRDTQQREGFEDAAS
jgi:mono/diheme cytochrome c family protein